MEQESGEKSNVESPEERGVADNVRKISTAATVSTSSQKVVRREQGVPYDSVANE